MRRIAPLDRQPVARSLSLLKPLARACLMLGVGSVGLCADAAGPDAPIVSNQRVYLITLTEPAAAAFTDRHQIEDQQKASVLRPTSIQVTGARKLDATSSAVRAYRSYLAGRQQQAVDRIAASLGRKPAVTAQWDLVGNGMAMVLSADEAMQIARLPGVLSVAPEQIRYLQSGIGARYVGADQVWNGTVPDYFRSSRGEGVVVGVIDSGLNTSHPAFADVSPDGYNHSNPRGQRYGICNNVGEARCSDKVIGLYDFVNENNATGANAGKDLVGHGTHVAGIAIGNSIDFSLNGDGFSIAMSITGTAPRANLIAYKACIANAEGNGVCPGGATVAAINQAVADGVDVVNYSIGGFSSETPWSPNDADAQAFLNLRNAGIVAVVAAGNHSVDEPSAVASPAYSPWVIAAANVTSNAQFRTTLADIHGTGITTPFTLFGSAVTGGVADSEVVYAGDFGNALCGTGTSQGVAPTGASNPFPAGTFTGKIVICDRGTYARVEKGFNVRQSGAVGYVLANTSAEGGSLVTDQHYLPAVHLSFANGDTLKAAVRAARQASGSVRARIDGVVWSTDGQGSVLSSSSNIGPVSVYSGVQKPDLAAPGTDILAPHIPDATSIDSLSGTSMAAPAIAGAAALLIGLNPTWTVDQVSSALVATAVRNVKLSDGQTDAPFYQGGNGTLSLPRAVKAGLHLRVTGAEFAAANPAIGGQPVTLNLPALHRQLCVPSCSFTRTLTANVGGTWIAQGTVPVGTVSVQPNSLALAQGQSATVSITVTPPAGGAGWIEGVVSFVSTSNPNQIASTDLPISVFAPIEFTNLLTTVENVASSGDGTVNLLPGVAVDEVVIRDAELKPFELAPINVGLDATPGDPYDITTQNFTRLVSKPSAAPGVDATKTAIFVETGSNNSQNLDLFIGIDSNGDGRPQQAEELCRRTTAGASEQCLLLGDFTQAGRQYWIMVQNRANSGAANDQPVLGVYNGALDGGADLQFSAQSLRGKLTAGQFVPVEISWNLPAFGPNTSAMAMIAFGSRRESPTNLGLMPILFKRDGTSRLPPMMLKAIANDSRALALQPGQAQDRMIIDVPANASALILRTSAVGGDIDLYVSKVDDAGPGPGIPTAPARDQQPFRSITAGSDEVVALEGTDLTPGRYFVTPVNVGASAAAVSVNARTEFAGVLTQPAANGYFNPARSGHGVFLARTPDVWALAWYTFDSSGRPIWYTAQGAAAGAADSTWTAPIYRSTWNGVRDNPQQVGEVLLTFDGTGSFRYSWFLDGQYGSEPFVPIGAPVCANANLSVGGGWLRPDQTGWGSYFLNFAGNFEAEAIYVYDSNGLPRWVIGEGTYATTLQKNLFQVSGFCPTCDVVATTRTQVGTASRTLNSSTQGTFSSNFVFTNGAIGSWEQNNVAWLKLTPSLACP
ncbi:hypothetical protein C7S18_09950 [Ahniella affigens]|uniref:Peptidase S8/S53 domain-containing protein n=1 Tax=Ahniella affigens TaxID=2021234 RepID=A0A2P1PRM0_9GAMM|nr:S8 family serine peptidase [Ahniella affigens]AVP97496.1 hypothetical protein C7S18_09950 [Ahniella affigens]